MHLHILGIGGTFMAGIAILAKQLGNTVTGSDKAIYPPMSTQLATLGISYYEGYLAEHLHPSPECVVIGNALSRGNLAIEAVLNQGLNYISGPQWLAEQVLAKRWVLAVAGTHGKTTTASMLAWILDFAGLAPGFLIGGIPNNFGVSARLGQSPFFVVEADEYDTAFFDKRSKFLHYRPKTLILNNLEFDHADIFADLAAIQKQFHYLIRTVPGQGKIIYYPQPSIEQVLQQGCWSVRETFGSINSDWQVKDHAKDYSEFTVCYQGQPQSKVQWELIGEHNANNALAAISSAHHVGVPISIATTALGQFSNVKRRLELRGEIKGIKIYDDFAHHPTAIATTLQALRQRIGSQRIIAVVEPRSNSMKLGIYRESLPIAFADADSVLLYEPAGLEGIFTTVTQAVHYAQKIATVEQIIQHLIDHSQSGDHILVMSNGSFENIHQRLLTALSTKM